MIRKLNNLSKLLPEEMEEAGDDILEMLLSSMPEYPPPIPGSRYIRTYTLHEAVRSRQDEHEMSLSRVEDLGDGIRIHLGVDDYGPYVVGLARQQARVHKGRWWKLSDVIRDNTRRAKKIVESHVRRSFASSGF